MEFTAEQKQELKKMRVKWIAGTLLFAFLATAATVELLAHRRGGFSLLGIGIVVSGPKDTPIVMEGGSIHAYSYYSWTPATSGPPRLTTALADRIKGVTILDDASKPVYVKDFTDVNGNDTNEWAIDIVHTAPNRSSTFDAIIVTPNLNPHNGGDKNGHVVDLITKLNPHLDTDGRYRFLHDDNCSDVDNNGVRCDTLAAVVVKIEGVQTQSQPILCSQGKGAGYCQVVFRIK